MTQDLLLTGPFNQQVLASSVQVQSNTSGGAVLSLGQIAGAVGSATRNTNGLPTAGLAQRLTDVLIASGQHLPASATGTNFGLTFAAATGATVVSPSANNSSIAPVAALELVLPSNYVAGQDITLSVQQNIVIGAGTVTTKTLTATAYLQSAAGASGANLIATAAQTLTNASITLTFTITGTTLLPGSRVLVLLTGALTETAASAVTFLLSSIKMS